MTVGEKLKKIRIENKLSQNDFATRLCVSRTTYLLVEKGDREISVKMLDTLYNEFQVSSDWILYEDGLHEEKLEDVFYFAINVFKTYKPVFLLVDEEIKKTPKYTDKIKQANYNSFVSTYNDLRVLYDRCEENRIIINDLLAGTYSDNLSEKNKSELSKRITSFTKDAMILCIDFSFDFIRKGIEDCAKEITLSGFNKILNKIPFK